MDNIRLLLNAVVEQAATDYIYALCNRHWALSDKDIERYDYDIEQLENFFTGDNIRGFTKVDGNYIMKKLRRMVKDHNYDYEAIRNARAVYAN